MDTGELVLHATTTNYVKEKKKKSQPTPKGSHTDRKQKKVTHTAAAR